MELHHLIHHPVIPQKALPGNPSVPPHPEHDSIKRIHSPRVKRLLPFLPSDISPHAANPFKTRLSRPNPEFPIFLHPLQHFHAMLQHSCRISHSFFFVFAAGNEKRPTGISTYRALCGLGFTDKKEVFPSVGDDLI